MFIISCNKLINTQLSSRADDANSRRCLQIEAAQLRQSKFPIWLAWQTVVYCRCVQSESNWYSERSWSSAHAGRVWNQCRFCIPRVSPRNYIILSVRQSRRVQYHTVVFSLALLLDVDATKSKRGHLLWFILAHFDQRRVTKVTNFQTFLSFVFMENQFP